MSNIVDWACDIYLKIIDSRDHRLSHLPFMENPATFLILISTYLLIVRNGKHFMEHRKPFNIEKLIIVYNILQICVNAALFVMACDYILDPINKFSLVCHTTDYSTAPNAVYVAKLAYSYFILKIFDFLDTIFFILRKKDGHVSFLHVYHHIMVVACSYLALLYAPAGQAVMLGFWNTFVHAVMYGYYFLTLSMPSIKSSTWLKKNITRLQMVQFAYLVMHFGHGFVIPGKDCGHPKVLSVLGITQNMFMIVLFSNFYRKTYYDQSKRANKIE